MIFRFQLSLQQPLPNCHVWFFPRAASPTQARDVWSLRLTLHWTRQTGCLATAWANSGFYTESWGFPMFSCLCSLSNNRNLPEIQIQIVWMASSFHPSNKPSRLSEASRYVSFAWRLETLGNSCDKVVVGDCDGLIPAPGDTLGEALWPWSNGGMWWIYPIYSADPQ